MSTKKPSNRYGHTKHSRQGKPSRNINYPWAKGFTRGGLKRHFNEHGAEFNCNTIEEYVAKAIRFANTINRQQYESVVDYKGTTYKYNPKTNVLVEVTKDGYIVSFRHYGKEFWYYYKRGKKTWIKK